MSLIIFLNKEWLFGYIPGAGLVSRMGEDIAPILKACVGSFEWVNASHTRTP